MASKSPAAQVRRLETVLGKLENLENLVGDRLAREWLNKGKRELLEALRVMERIADPDWRSKV